MPTPSRTKNNEGLNETETSLEVKKSERENVSLEESIPQSQMPDSLLEMRRKLDDIHVEVQKAKVDMSNFISLYERNKSVQGDAVTYSGRTASELSDIYKKIDNLLDEKIDKDLSPEEELDAIHEAVIHLASIEQAVKVGEQKLSSELKGLNTEVDKLKSQLDEVDWEFVGVRALKYFSTSKKRKHLVQLQNHIETTKKERDDLEIIGRNAEHTKNFYTETKAEYISRDKVKLYTTLIGKKYEEILQSKEFVNCGNYFSEAYIQGVLEKAEGISESARHSIEEALQDYIKTETQGKTDYTVQSRLADVRVGNTTVERAIQKIGHQKFHQRIASSMLCQDMVSEIKGMVQGVPYDKSRSQTPYGDAISNLKLDQSDRLFFERSASIDNDELEIWDVVKRRPEINTAFGKTVSDLDSNIYDMALKGSIESNSGAEIDQLKLYPTPESIRNLFLLAGTYAGRRTENSIKVLNELATQEDWPEIFGKAKEKYPGLESVASLVTSEDGTMIPSLNFNQVQKESTLPASLYKKFRDNELPDATPKLMETALAALTTEELIEAGNKSSVINKGMREKLTSTCSVILQQKLEGGKVPAADTANYIDLLRNHFVEILSKPDSDISSSYYQFEWQMKDVFLPIATEILKNANDEKVSKALSEGFIMSRFKNHKTSYAYEDSKLFQMMTSDIERAETLAPLYKTSNPEIFDNPRFTSKKGFDYLIEFAAKFMPLVQKTTYSEASPAGMMLDMVSRDLIDQKWALEMPDSALEMLKGEFCPIAFKYSKQFLSSPEAIDYSQRCLLAYGKNLRALYMAASATASTGSLPGAEIDKFPQMLPALINTEKLEDNFLLAFVLNNGEILLKEPVHTAFVNRVVGIYGNQAQTIIQGYIECIKSNVVNKENSSLVSEFLERFRVVSPNIIKGYIDAKAKNQQDIYIAEMSSMAEGIGGARPFSDAERDKPYFNDILRHVYPNNSGQFGNYEKNELCSDRTADLAVYKVRPKYEIDLFAVGQVSLKEGTELDKTKLAGITEKIIRVQKEFETVGFDPEKMVALVDGDINTLYKELTGKEENSESISREGKLMKILGDSLYSKNSGINQGRIKDVIIRYEFAHFQDVRDYIAGTSDRLSNAPNKDYALLCELNEFFNDRIKEVDRRILEKGYENEDVKQVMKGHFENLSIAKNEESVTSKLNKLQVEKLGMTPAFLNQIRRSLEQRTGKKYTDEKLERLIGLYEKMTEGLVQKSTTSKSKRTQAFYGQLKSQRDKTMEAVRQITGKDVDPASIHLGEINLPEMMKAERTILSGTYDENQFAAYTVQRLINIFSEEQQTITTELDKFVSTSGKVGQKLNAYVSKTKESANARMVGGVCVARDNPTKENRGEGAKNMWDMPNYLQMVFQNPDNLQSQGLVLMHTYEEGKEDKEEKVLTVSLNPSSTYLYSVDEKAMFTGIMGQLEKFAEDNNFDKILMSTNKAIRTNRTGGKFEEALNERVSKVAKGFKFAEPARFSYTPSYNMESMDVVWERAKPQPKS